MAIDLSIVGVVLVVLFQADYSLLSAVFRLQQVVYD